VNEGANGTAVTAVPAAGYHFVSWSDDLYQNPRTDTNVTADITVMASFAINTYTLAYTEGPGGTIAGTSSQTVLYGEAGSEVTAMPDEGYLFESWSDEVLTAVRTDANVMADVAVMATFAPVPSGATLAVAADLETPLSFEVEAAVVEVSISVSESSGESSFHVAQGGALTIIPPVSFHYWQAVADVTIVGADGAPCPHRSPERGVQRLVGTRSS
jgi:hypothetical protein